MNDIRMTWDTYTRSWKAASAEERTALFAQALSEQCVYTDPLTQRAGWDALREYMVEFHQQVPGGHFRTVEFFAHHGRSAARWEMLGADETVLGTGMSYGEYDEDGRLLTMTGFFATPAVEAE